MDRLKPWTLLPLALLGAGCPSAPKEAPPPAESFSVASGAPRALGALAAGTKAAPRALLPSTGRSASPDEEEPLYPEGDDADGGPAPQADAGTAPEDLPL
jgi:hypothetical protein